MSSPAAAPISWKALFVEAFFIVFSVLLALGVNEWREERAQAHTAEVALTAIARELGANRRFLESRLPYHRAMRDTLAARQGQPLVAIEQIPGWRGLSPPLLRDASYQTALATNAFGYMDFRTAAALAQVYALQSIYTGFIDKYATAFTTTDMRDIRRLFVMFSELEGFGTEVARAYEQILPLLPTPPENEDLLFR